MTRPFLHRNQVVAVRGELARVLTLLPDGETWQFETLHDGLIHRHADSEIRRLYVDGHIDLDPVQDDKTGKAVATLQSKHFEDYSAEQRKEAKRRLHYVKAAIAAELTTLTDNELAELIGVVASEIGDQRGPRLTTVRRWVTFYLTGRGDIRALIPSWHRRGNRVVRQYIVWNGNRCALPSHESEEWLTEALREYLRRERPRGSSCYQYVKSYFARQNAQRPISRQVRVPSRATAFRRLAAMDPYEKAYFRYGKARADHLLKVKSDGPVTSFPLERVEMDATRLDVFVVAPGSCLVIGRPWITVAIDRFSRAILGFYLGFEPPSAISVMHCLRHAIGPKDGYVEQFGSGAYAWPMHGVPLLVVVDNAREYQSETIGDATLQLGFDLQHHPVKWPHWKGTIERFFRTLNEGVLAWVPGKSFHSIAEKGDYDAEKVAVLELPTLQTLITKWIILEYNTTRHEGIRDVPARLWEEGSKKSPPSLPPRVQDLDVLLAYTRTMTLTPTGIRFQNLQYRSEEAHAILIRNGGSVKVKVKIDDRDISIIRVLDQDSGQYIPVSVQEKYADYARGLSLAEHIAVQRYRRRVAEDAENRPDLIEARNLLAEELSGLLRNNRARSREKMWAARVSAHKLADSRAVRGAFDPFESGRSISAAILGEGDDADGPQASDMPENMSGASIDGTEKSTETTPQDGVNRTPGRKQARDEVDYRTFSASGSVTSGMHPGGRRKKLRE